MPEGHILHRLAGEITELFAGEQLQSSSPQGRFEDAELLDGLRLKRSWARGKHLFVEFENFVSQVHVHLGLYGAFTFTPQTHMDVTGLVRWRLESDTHTMDLRGPSRCELLEPVEVQAILDRLGPDPLDADADFGLFRDRLSRSSRSIAAMLMDQKVLSGVGNVYRAEVLFRLGIDPWTPARDLSEIAVIEIWDDLVEQMWLGMVRGRIDTVRPEHEPEAMDRDPRRDDHGGEVYVYRRADQPCHVCGETVRTTVVDGRNLFWCPTCQSSN